MRLKVWSWHMSEYCKVNALIEAATADDCLKRALHALSLEVMPKLSAKLIVYSVAQQKLTCAQPCMRLRLLLLCTNLQAVTSHAISGMWVGVNPDKSMHIYGTGLGMQNDNQIAAQAAASANGS